MQRPQKERRAGQALLVEFDGLFIVAQEVVFVREPVQGFGVVRVHVHGPLEVFDGSEQVAPVIPQAAHLKRVFRPCHAFAAGGLEDGFGFVEIARLPDRSRLEQRAGDFVVAVLGGLIVSLGGFFSAAEIKQRPAPVKRGHAVFGQVVQHVRRLAMLAQQIRHHAQHQKIAFGSQPAFAFGGQFAQTLPNFREMRPRDDDLDFLDVLFAKARFFQEDFPNLGDIGGGDGLRCHSLISAFRQGIGNLFSRGRLGYAFERRGKGVRIEVGG